MLDAPSSPDWHQNTVQAIEAALQRYPFYSCFPYAGHKLMGYPLLKRSGDRTAIVWRKAFDAAVTAGELPPPLPPFHAEIRKRISTESE
jgi:hypothetical protein